MKEDEVRRLLLVRAIEREDADATLLTEEDRRQADLAGKAAMGEGPERRADANYLARRAEFAAGRVATRHPAVERALGWTRWPSWIGWVLPLAALIAGYLANELGNGKRLDLLAVPLIGLFAWNLLVYLWIVLRSLFGGFGGGRPAGLERLVARIAGWGQRRIDQATPVARALHGFVREWSAASAPLAAARTSRTLHLAAAMFALGVIAGIYLRALAIEYRAGWESTFLGAGDVHALLTTLLGPASAATGVGLPDVAGFAAIRWSGPTTGGTNAALWIHLYTATVLGAIVVPRLLLAAWQGVRAIRLSRNFPVPGREDFYIRRLLRSARGTAGSIRVTPYAYNPDADLRHRVTELLRQAFGDAAQVHFDDPVDYGKEDTWLSAATLRPQDDHHVLLFTLSATPEAENHGALASGLADRLRDDRHGTALSALVDESAWRAHFAGQSGLEDRVATRRRAWDEVLAPARVAPLSIDLAAGAPDDAQRIEAALVSGPAMEQTR